MQGLRTLVYGYKELTEEEVAKYEKNYNNAKNAMANR